jgi:2-amino-4-hydroxy-6-hydroxymethyldihydropteridine diphosphokinase
MIYHLLLGSNMHNPELQIELAVQNIEQLPEITVLKRSSLRRSLPYGKLDQPDFYNQALELESSLAPQALLKAMQELETKMGRIRSSKWGPRIIDIDILLIQDQIIATPDLQVPHYDLHNRAFALNLLCEIAPDALHPKLQKTMCELRQALSSPGGNT